MTAAATSEFPDAIAEVMSALPVVIADATLSEPEETAVENISASFSFPSVKLSDSLVLPAVMTFATSLLLSAIFSFPEAIEEVISELPEETAAATSF